ncbi:hypothetical protein [Allokutzneria oryzae]|uniref:Uncharacterized protein n=1 Tax=Allokutzneria oryzae TaxID=1378989 RepID=A0ABV6A8P9_9PSEU
MRTNRTVVVGLVCLTLAVSTGSASGEGLLRAQQPTPKVTDGVAIRPEDEKRLPALARARQIDACALLDPGSVKAIFGGVPRDVTPQDLDGCSMSVELSSSSVDGWRIAVESSQLMREDPDSEKLELHGRTFTGKESEPIGGRPVSSCTWMMPTSEGRNSFAISLNVSWSGTGQPPKPPCALAKEYLVPLAPYWITPPLRGEGATKPELVLGTKNPCAALPELAKRFAVPGEQPRQEVIAPYSCTMTLTEYKPETRAPSTRLGISFGWSTNPVYLTSVKDSSFRAATVAGKPAAVTMNPISRSCQVDVQYDPTTIPERFATEPTKRKMQVITVTAPTCEVAEPAAEIVVKGAL